MRIKFFVLTLMGLMLVLPALAGPMSDAAKKGDASEVERLLLAGTSANEDDAMASPLHWAAMKGHAAVVKLLAENGADVNAQSSMLGAPLHAASRFDRTDAIKALLTAGADPDIRDRNEFTPLMRAVVENRSAAVEILLEGGADVNAIGIAPGGLQIGRGPTIALQLSIRFERDDITSMLRSAGAAPIPPVVPSNLATLGDAKQGRELAYDICSACHRIEKADPETTGDIIQGPPLISLIGRPVANVSGYKYSEDLIAYGGTWTPERFYQFGLSPTLTVPGTRMVDSEDRTADIMADITAYFISKAK